MDLVLLFLILPFIPILVVVGGILLERFITWLDSLATSPLLFVVKSEGKKSLLKTLASILTYYFIVSTLIALMIKNLLIAEFYMLHLQDWQIYFLAFSLSYLPRLMRYATGIVEKARYVLLSVLTPLTLMALPMLLLKPESLSFPTHNLTFFVIALPLFTVVGDLVCDLSIRKSLLNPKIDIETVGITDLRRNIRTGRIVEFSNLCSVMDEAVERNRPGIVDKIADALIYGIDISIKRRNPKAIVSILTAVVDLQREEAVSKLTHSLDRLVDSTLKISYPTGREALLRILERPRMLTLGTLETFTTSCILAWDDKLRQQSLEALLHYVQTNKLSLADIDCLREMLKKESNARTLLVDQLATQIRYDTASLELAKSLYEEPDLYVKSAAARSLIQVLEPDELREFTKNIKDDQIRILVESLLEARTR